MKTAIAFVILVLAAGCTSLRPSTGRQSIDNADTLEAQHKLFLCYAKPCLVAMHEPLALTSHLRAGDFAYRVVIIPQMAGDAVCIRVERTPDNGDAFMTVKVLTRKYKDGGWVPDRLIYSNQQIMSARDFQSFQTLVRRLDTAKSESSGMMFLDGEIHAVEGAFGQYLYLTVLRNCPDPVRAKAFFSPQNVRLIREVDPLFDPAEEIAVQREFVDLFEWLAKKTGLKSLKNRY